nr:Uma2 family endonuclease [Dyadobacter fermentans]
MELIHGRIYKMVSSPGTLHQCILGRFCLRLFEYFKSRQLILLSAPFDVRLPGKDQSTADEDVLSVVQPDICVCEESKLDERGCIGAPELVIEILLPDYSKTELHNKFDLYQESGVREYWIVQPAYQNVLLFTLSTNGKYIDSKPATEVLHSVTFPDLTIDLKEIFS